MNVISMGARYAGPSLVTLEIGGGWSEREDQQVGEGCPKRREYCVLPPAGWLMKVIQIKSTGYWILSVTARWPRRRFFQRPACFLPPMIKCEISSVIRNMNHFSRPSNLLFHLEKITSPRPFTASLHANERTSSRFSNGTLSGVNNK